jgi:predicted metal-dependent peptidase
VARSISTTTKNTRKKINRRFGLEQPGKKKKRELTLGVCVDSSGSVSDEAFQSFLTEVSRISQICQTTYLVDADCVVQNVDVIKKGKKVKNQRSGSGGTAYQPAIDKCLELKCDAIVYFGDADSSDIPKNPNIPFLWVIVGNQNPPGNFGSVVRL